MYVFVCALRINRNTRSNNNTKKGAINLRGVCYLRAEGNLLGDIQGGKTVERNKKEWKFYFA